MNPLAPVGSYQRVPEIKAKQFRANKIAWQNPEIRARYLASFVNRPPVTQKTKDKIAKATREAIQKLQQDPKWVQEQSQLRRHPHLTYRIKDKIANSKIRSENSKKKVFTEEYRRHLSEARRKRPPKSEEERTKLSRAHKRLWANPEYARRVASLQNRRPNQAELKLLTILNKLFPNEWKYVGDGQVWIGGRNPDFININGGKTIIELFSAYWHLERARTVDDKQDRVSHYKQYGFDCLVLWDTRLTEEEVLECLP